MRHYQFRLDPLFAGLKPSDREAQVLLQASRLGGQALSEGDQLWLNRHLLEAAFRKATGRPCFRRLNSGLDGVLVSDVGKPIEVLSSQRPGGLIRTALRATDILMDRVWQLEIETFRDARGFVFAPITEVVEPAEDPTSLHPEIQRQVARIRTDLDRFSPLEISSLIRHGYCVGRKACRAHPERFGNDLPGNAPWDPLHAPQGAAPNGSGVTLPDRPTRAPAAATADARALQPSAFRRIWSTLLDRRDWASYIYVPIIIPILFLLPYVAFTTYRHMHQYNKLVQSFSQGTSDLETLSEMLDGKPETWAGEHAEKVRSLDEPDLTGFQILQDSRIIDLRGWQPGAAADSGRASGVVIHRRMKVLKLRENKGNNLFRLHMLPTSPLTAVRFPPPATPAQSADVRAGKLHPRPREVRLGGGFRFPGRARGGLRRTHARRALARILPGGRPGRGRTHLPGQRANGRAGHVGLDAPGEGVRELSHQPPADGQAGDVGSLPAGHRIPGRRLHDHRVQVGEPGPRLDLPGPLGLQVKPRRE
jgi:hypothetical protein